MAARQDNPDILFPHITALQGKPGAFSGPMSCIIPPAGSRSGRNSRREGDVLIKDQDHLGSFVLKRGETNSGLNSLPVNLDIFGNNGRPLQCCFTLNIAATIMFGGSYIVGPIFAHTV